MNIERERRLCPASGLRASGGAATAEGLLLSGYAAVFGSVAALGDFTEELAPRCFDDVLNDDVRALFNHNPDHLLGRAAAGTLRLRQDSRGLLFEVDLNAEDPDALKLVSRIKRGDLSGASFSFKVAPGGETWRGTHRTITRIGRLFDVGPVSWPAYPTTSAKVSTPPGARQDNPPRWAVDAARRRKDLDALLFDGSAEGLRALQDLVEAEEERLDQARVRRLGR